ncbi:hypothetical protein FA13DRAFT_1185354 [Coprinellus micaceus]|uniref:Uncharacterized protein n=1 Tax=Coprinellus micaceus TaxID=71717 RepID=A0A4Y7STR5_COPMI|nr:hypothetical protein FA13DRAFT_1185354 [Coprinellus micaceus]
MFQEASHFATGDVSQVNAKNYHTSTSNVVHDGGRYAPYIHINANKVYNHIEDWGSANLDASVKELYSHVAVGALHDSSERCDAPKCHFETRVAVQNDIFGWITGGGTEPQPKRVL